MIVSSDTFGVATIWATAFDFVPLGFWICMDTLPAMATSAAVTSAVHWSVEVHVVTRAVAPLSIAEAGPRLAVPDCEVSSLLMATT